MREDSDIISPYSQAHELMRALRERQVSAVELLGMYRERRARHNATLNAIVIANDDQADRQARAADMALAGGGPTGALLGLPITIKDCIDTVGLPTTAGVPERMSRVAAADAPVAAAMRAAGAVIMGKTNTSTDCGDWQANNALFGCTNNPWDLARTPGGSTGGGAAALASGLTALEIGSDIGGSIRVPAAFCGLYGHRPSETSVPRYGYVPDLPTYNPGLVLNALGPLARGAADLESALDVIAGPVTGEDVAWRLSLPPARHNHLSDFRVAVLPWQDWLPVDEEIITAVEDCADHIRKTGATVAWAAPGGPDLQAQEHLYTALLAIMETRFLSPEKRARLAESARQTGSPIGAAQAEGWLASAADYLEMLDRREAVRARYWEFFRAWDILICPVALTPAFEHIPESIPLYKRELRINGKMVPYDRLTVYPGVATLPGHPATAFPWGRSRSGLPIGLQAVGPYLEDRTALRFTQLLEREFGGFQAPPGY
jgi:amidase